MLTTHVIRADERMLQSKACRNRKREIELFGITDRYQKHSHDLANARRNRDNWMLWRRLLLSLFLSHPLSTLRLLLFLSHTHDCIKRFTWDRTIHYTFLYTTLWCSVSPNWSSTNIRTGRNEVNQPLRTDCRILILFDRKGFWLRDFFTWSSFG